MSNSLPPHLLQLTKLLCPWNFPGKNTGTGCYFLLQGIFPTLGSNPSPPHWQVDSLITESPGRPTHHSANLISVPQICTAPYWCSVSAQAGPLLGILFPLPPSSTPPYPWLPPSSFRSVFSDLPGLVRCPSHVLLKEHYFVIVLTHSVIANLKSESCSVVSHSLWPHGLYSPWNFPGQNTVVGSLSFLQGIFPTQGMNPGLLHCR